MATIKAPCPSCGVVRLGVPQVTVMVDDASNHAYRFHCPRCTTSVVHPITPGIGALLRSVGVDEEHVATGGPEHDPSTRAFTGSDATDLHRLLESDDWFDQLLATVHAEGDRS